MQPEEPENSFEDANFEAQLSSFQLREISEESVSELVRKHIVEDSQQMVLQLLFSGDSESPPTGTEDELNALSKLLFNYREAGGRMARACDCSIGNYGPNRECACGVH
jgi:hypothetical protein